MKVLSPEEFDRRIEEVRRALLDGTACTDPLAAEKVMDIGHMLIEFADDPVNELPDYVRVVGNGNWDHPLDVCQVALADLLSDEQVNDASLQPDLAPASPQPSHLTPDPSPVMGGEENREGRQEQGQGLVLYVVGVALLAVLVMALIGIAQSVVGVFSANPAGMQESIRSIPEPAVVEQVNQTTAVIIGTMAVTTNPVIVAEFEAEIQEKSHPVEKHGEEALAVNACIDAGGQLAEWVNPDTHRRLKLCQIADGKYSGKYGLQVLEENSEWVTSFIKNKMTKLDQVLQYLVNAGYRPF